MQLAKDEVLIGREELKKFFDEMHHTRETGHNAFFLRCYNG